MSNSSRRSIWHRESSSHPDRIGLFLALALPLYLPGVLRADTHPTTCHRCASVTRN